MKRKRTFGLILLIVALLLSACGPQSDTPADPGDTGDGGGAEEQIELVYWSVWNEPEPQAQVIQQWIDAFEEENPNVTFEVVWNGRENQTKIRTALGGGTGTQIDLMDLDADFLRGGLLAEGYGYSLEGLLDRQALDEDMSVQEVFVPGVLDMHKLNDEVYLWPYVYNTIMFWYNQRAFEEAGTQAPETWSDLMEAGDALNGAGYTPIAFEGDHPDFGIHYYGYLIARLKGTGFLLQAIEDETGEMWRDPAFLEAAQMERQLWEEELIPPEAKGYIWPQAQQTLAAGDSAAELTGSWTPTELRDSTIEDFEWGGFRFPAVEGGEGSRNDLTAWLMSFMIMKDTEHPEILEDFLLFIMTEENQQLMADEALVGVPRSGVAWPEILYDGQVAAEEAETLFMNGDGCAAYYPEYYENVLTRHHQEMFVGDATPEEFIENMVSGTQSYWESH